MTGHRSGRVAMSVGASAGLVAALLVASVTVPVASRRVAAVGVSSSVGLSSGVGLLDTPPPPTAYVAPGGSLATPTTFGESNAGVPGVSATGQSVADSVDPGTGDFSQSGADVSVPTYGPSLEFDRSYDAGLAQQQTSTGSGGTSGGLGYGWSDNWSTSLSTGQSLPGDLYTVDGIGSDNGDQGGATGAPLAEPQGEIFSGSNLYIADTTDNRVQEVAGTTGTQWGISMIAGDVYTIVGNRNGVAGASGNGTPHGSAALNQPTGLTVDSAGDLYIADTGNNRVIELPIASGGQWGLTSMTAGDIYAVIGAASRGCGSTGNGTADTSSTICAPTDVKLNGTDLYAADAGNNRVVEVAGSTKSEWSLSMTADDVYTVLGGTEGCSANGTTATSAALDDPSSISLDSAGNLYATDADNNRVVEDAKAAGSQWGISSMVANKMYTVAGNVSGTNGDSGDGGVATSAKLSEPESLEAISGNIYIADSINNRVQEVSGSSHTEFGVAMSANDMYTIAGSSTGVGGYTGNGGAATSAKMDYPQGVRIDTAGDVYISDSGNNVVREVNVTTADISTVAGNGGTLTAVGDGGAAITASLDNPQATVVDAAGNVYIADSINDRVQEIAATTHTQWTIPMTAGDVYIIAGIADGGPGSSTIGTVATGYELNGPDGVAVDSSGDLFISNEYDDTVLEVPASSGTQFGQSMTLNDIYVIAGSVGDSNDTGNNGPGLSATLEAPTGLLVDAAGDVVITDQQGVQVRVLAATSHTQWGVAMTANDIYAVAGVANTPGTSGDNGVDTSSKLELPSNVAIDSTGDLYIADDCRVQEIAGATRTQWGIAMTKNDIYTVVGSATDSHGSSPAGGAATSSLFGGIWGLALDSSNDLYITDSGNNRVNEIPAATGVQWGGLFGTTPMTAGDVYFIAGSSSGTSGFSGDGASGPSALLNYPEGLATDSQGDLFIDDTGNNRLREVAAEPNPVVPVNPTGSGVTYNDPSGAQDTYYPPNSGTCSTPYTHAASADYCALSDVASNLTYNSSPNTYTLALPGGQADTYSGSTGQLTSEADTAGDTLTVAYNTPAPGSGACPSGANNCTTITAANGRKLTLGQNSSNQVTSVTDPLGTWNYTYTSGNLTSATDPLANKTSYTYDATGTNTSGTNNPLLAHNILTVTAPNGQPGGTHAGTHTTNVYDTYGRVTTQTDPAGWTTHFDYTCSTGLTGCVSFSPATGDGTVVVTDPNGNFTADTYTSGALTATDVGAGAAGDTVTNYTPDAASLFDDATATTVGTTNMVYDADGDVTSDMTPLLDTTTSGYTSTAADTQNCATTAQAASVCGTGGTLTPPAVVTAGGTITPPSSAPPKGVTYSLVDTNGNTLWTTTGVYQPGASTASYSQTTYSLYAGNSVTLGATTTNCGATPPSLSLPCATIDADKVVTQLAYDSAGDLASSSTPDGNSTEIAKTTYAYDGDGDQTSITAPDGNLTGASNATIDNYTTTNTYDADNNTLTTTQAGGTLGSGPSFTPRTTTHTYDADGNQITSVSARGYTTTTAYTADDQPTLVTDPDGNATLTCYDGNGKTTETVPPAGVAANILAAASCPTTYTTTDTANRLATDATTNAYNAQGVELTETTPAPAGQTGYETTRFTYDADDNLLTTTAPPNTDTEGAPNDVTTNTYNADDQLASTTNGSGTSVASTTSYCYNPEGDTTAIVAPDGNTGSLTTCATTSPWTTTSGYQTAYGYDSAGEEVSTTTPVTTAAPSGATTTITYDSAGNVLTSTDPDGITITKTYTPEALVASTTYSGGSAHSVAFTYDADGERMTTVDGTGTTSDTYDAFAELTSEQDGAGNTTSYSYDADSDVSGITYPLPPSATWATTDTVSYAYDHADELTAETDFNGNDISITDNPDGLPSLIGLGTSGDTIKTAYDSADDLSVMQVMTGSYLDQGYTYTFAPSSVPLTETDSPDAAGTAEYAYDAAGRLTSYDNSSASESISHDSSSNLTSLPDGSAATYDKAGELSDSTRDSATTTDSYSADSELLSQTDGGGPVAGATWSGSRQLTSYSGPVGNMSSADYGAAGLRESTTTTETGGLPVTNSFVWSTESSPSLLEDSTEAYIYTTNPGAPAEQVSLATGAVTYLVSDSASSERGAVSATGGIVGQCSYDPTGDPVSGCSLAGVTAFGPMGNYVDATGLLYSPGGYSDSETGQPLIESQQMDPSVGISTSSSGGDEIVSSLGDSFAQTSANHGSNLLQPDAIGGKVGDAIMTPKHPNYKGKDPDGEVQMRTKFDYLPTGQLSQTDNTVNWGFELSKRDRALVTYGVVFSATCDSYKNKKKSGYHYSDPDKPDWYHWHSTIKKVALYPPVSYQLSCAWQWVVNASDDEVETLDWWVNFLLTNGTIPQ